MRNDEVYLVEDDEKVVLLRDIIAFMTGESIGKLRKFIGRVEEKNMIVSFDIGDMCPALDISRSSFPLSGENALLSDIIKRVRKFTITPHYEYVTIEFTIGDYLIEESLDY